jgi:integrase
MTTVHYYLKGAMSDKTIEELKKTREPSLNKNLNKPLQVYLTLSGLGKRIQIYTKKRISQYEWDKEKELVDCRKNRVNGTEINLWLVAFSQAVDKHCSINEINGKTTTIEELRKILDSITPSGAKKTANTFQEYFDLFLQEHKTVEGHSKRIRTIQKYNTLNSHLIEFAEKKKIRLQIEVFDINFLFSFKNYLIKDKNLGDNTVTKYIKTAKTFIQFYINKGLIKPFNLSEIKSVEKPGEIYVIDLKQLMELQNYKLKNKRLEQCRDVFCFQCWTGQRYSDIAAINSKDLKTNSKGETTWDFYAIKIGKNIKVPITENAAKILNKYKNGSTLLPVISNQKQNEYLKELGKLVSSDTKKQKKIDGFDKDTKMVEHNDGVRKETYVKFYDVLTTHVARKSYITNSLILGVLERIIKEVTGHTSEINFRRYVKMADSFKDQTIRTSFSMKNISSVIKKLN